MERKGKLVRREEEHSALRKRLAENLSAAEARTLDEDFHLLQGAKVGDGIVLSRDRKIRSILVRLAAEHPDLQRLMWVDPHPDDSAAVVAWLAEGAPLEAPRCLGAADSKAGVHDSGDPTPPVEVRATPPRT
jgi:hypothetical protein